MASATLAYCDSWSAPSGPAGFRDRLAQQIDRAMDVGLGGAERLFEDRGDFFQPQPLHVAQDERRAIAVGELGHERRDVGPAAFLLETGIGALCGIVLGLPGRMAVAARHALVERQHLRALATGPVARDVQR